MRKIILESLKCYETEDWAGADECRLEIFLDGVLQAPLKNNLNDGQKWGLNRSYTFQNNVEVRLWDEDSPDRDDFLGKIVIDTNLKNHTTASFTGDDASYKLWYSVVDAPPIDPVQEAINKFEKSTKPGIWPYISKEDLVVDIREKVNNPFKVRQGRKPFCGPATIVFELVSKYPHKYIEICQQLYEIGTFQGRTKQVKPSQSLIKGRIGTNITIADWMLMATLRDAENALFPVKDDSGLVADVAGITTPWEMEGWAFEILGYNKVEYE